MAPELWSIIALVLVFALGTVLNINLGVLALTAMFVLAATVAGIPVADLFPLFPGSLFLLIFAVMFLLSLAKATGAIEWFVSVSITGVRGRIIFIPWVLFLIAAVTSALGPGAIVLLAGIGVSFARKYNISRLLLALMIVHGTQAGGFSPITPYSVLIGGLVEKAGYSYEPMVLFAGAAVFNTLAALVGFTALKGWELASRRERIGSFDRAAPPVMSAGAAASATPLSDDDNPLDVQRVEQRVALAERANPSEGDIGAVQVIERSIGAGGHINPPALSNMGLDGSGNLLRPTFLQVVTLVGILTIIAAVSIFQWDLAATTIVIAAVLCFIIPAKQRAGVFEGIAWSAVILLVGMLMFMALLQEMGTITWVVSGLQSVGSGLIALLIVCYIAGIVSAVASSFATLALTIPVALAIVGATDMGGLGVTMVATAIVVSSTIVDISPFSTFGAIVLGAAEPYEQSSFQKSLLKYAAVIVVLAPGAAWLALVLPAWLLL